MGFGGAIVGAILGAAAAPFTGGISLGVGILGGGAIGSGAEGLLDLKNARTKIKSAQGIINRANDNYTTRKVVYDENIAIYQKSVENMQNILMTSRMIWNIGSQYITIIKKELHLSDKDVMELSRKFFSTHGLMSQKYSTTNKNLDMGTLLTAIGGGIVGGIALETTGAAILGTLGLDTIVVGELALGSAATVAGLIVGPLISILGSVKLSQSKAEIDNAIAYEANLKATEEKMATQIAGTKVVANGIKHLEKYHDRIALCVQSLIIAANSIDSRRILRKLKLDPQTMELLLALDPNAKPQTGGIKSIMNDLVTECKSRFTSLPSDLVHQLKAILAGLVNILGIWKILIEMNVINYLEEETHKPIFNDSILITADEATNEIEMTRDQVFVA